MTIQPGLSFLRIALYIYEREREREREREGEREGGLPLRFLRRTPGACSGLRSGAWVCKRNNGRLGAFY